MVDRVRSLLARHVACYERGDHFTPLRDLRFPVTVSSPHGFVVMRTPEEAAEQLFQMKAASLARGADRVLWEIVEIPDPLPARFAATVRFVYVDKAGAQVAEKVLKYFFDQDEDGEIWIEMIEIVTSTLPVPETGTTSRGVPH